MNISTHYYAGDMGNQAMAEELLKVNADSLGTVGRETYDEMTGNIYPQVCSSLYSAAQESVDVANYQTAITNLEQVIQMDAGYNDGAAMLLLAEAYQGTAIRIRQTSTISASSKTMRTPTRHRAPRKPWMNRTAPVQTRMRKTEPGRTAVLKAVGKTKKISEKCG